MWLSSACRTASVSSGPLLRRRGKSAIPPSTSVSGVAGRYRPWADRPRAGLVDRALGGKRVRDIAERVFMHIQAAVFCHLDAPVDDVLAIVVAGGEAKRLDDAADRRVVAIAGLVGNADAHIHILATLLGGENQRVR